jgi:hypothetical protein
VKKNNTKDRTRSKPMPPKSISSKSISFDITTFLGIRDALIKCVQAPTSSAIASIPQIKITLHREPALFAGNERAWAWFMIGQIYWKLRRYDEAYDAISVSERFLDAHDTDLALEIYRFSITLASFNEDSAHVLVTFPKFLAVLRTILPDRFTSHADYTRFLRLADIAEANAG